MFNGGAMMLSALLVMIGLDLAQSYSLKNSSTIATNTTNSTVGHIDAVNHILSLPCKLENSSELASCSFFDSNAPHSTVVGVEYVISNADYDSLPQYEKPYWHSHTQENKYEAADPILSNFSAQESQEMVKNLNGTYGKVFLTWDPAEEIPSFSPRGTSTHRPSFHV